MNEISLHEYCEQIEIIIEQGRYAEAVAHGQHILKQYPKHVATYRLLGKAMLEANQDEYAADMFHRVLNADPEDWVAWVGISELHNRRGDLDAATWHLERAFEVASDNEAGIVEEELRHLYGRRDGVEPERVQLTRAALARLYLKGDLLSRAISEFRALLVEHPERVDLSVALAEALWRNEQRLEAVKVCQQVLDRHAYALKANLILGELWTRGGREEARTYLRRAEAVDPENQVAQELLGAASPLPAREIRLVPLEYRPPTEQERPPWMADLEAVSAAPPRAEREASIFGVAAEMGAQIELPSWLEEVGGEEAPAPTPPTAAELPEERPLEEAVPAPAEEAPEWLASIREGLVEEELEEFAEEETPERRAGLGLEPIEEEEKEEEVAEWPAELEVEPTGVGEAPALPGEEQAPEWLTRLGLEPIGEEEVAERPVEPGIEPTGVEEALAVPGEEVALEPLAELGVEAASEEAAPPVPPAELPEDWLAGLREQLAEEEEIPEELPTPAAEEMPTPAWLEGEEMPSGDEALAWLEQITAGKEEELQAQAEAEAEARLAEIMGRPQPAEAPPVEAAPEEAVAPPVEEPVAALEEAPPVEEVPTPAWLEGEGIPSGDEALAWLEQITAGKEEELQAQAEAEAEARLAEIMGRPQPAEAPPVEAAPEEAVALPVEEPFGWTAFGEPEAPPTPVAPVEEAAPAAEEMPTPAWLEGEGMPSGDEALAWLEQITAGKEEELQAQAEAEAEARLAEIMGRPQPAEAPPVEAAPEEAVAPPVEKPFGWTPFGEPEAPPTPVTPVEEAAPAAQEMPTPAWLEGEGMPSGDEALAWLEQLAAGKEEELQAQAEAEAEARLAEIMGRPQPEEAPPVEAAPEEAVAPPVEEPFGWTAFGEPEAPPTPVAPAEEAPPVEEIAPPEMPEPAYLEEVEAPPVVELPVLEEAPLPEEIPTPEAAPPTEEVHWGAILEPAPEMEGAPAPVVEEVPGVVEMELAELPEEPIAAPEIPIAEAAAVELPAEPFAAERGYLKDHPRDYEVWLALARALWQADDREESLEAYTRVIRAGKLLDSVTADLEGHVGQWPDASTQRVLGDAYMKDGRLRKALDIYRRALETL